MSNRFAPDASWSFCRWRDPRRMAAGLVRAAAAAVALVLAVLVGAGGPSRAWAHKNGIISGGSCNGCHTGGKIPTVTLSASPMNPAVGQPVIVTISVSQTNGPAAGFFLSTEFGSVGTFKAIEAGTAVNPVGVTHTMPRTGSAGVTTFNVQWSSSTATGVRFSVYALSANGDGTSSGDAGGEAVLNLACGCPGTTYTLDQDMDGYGTTDPAYPTRLDCSKPTMYAAVAGDCDDFDATVHPGAAELCDGKDDNCDGTVDEGTGLALCGVATASCARGVCRAGMPGGASGAGSTGSGGAADAGADAEADADAGAGDQRGEVAGTGGNSGFGGNSTRAEPADAGLPQGPSGAPGAGCSLARVPARSSSDPEQRGPALPLALVAAASSLALRRRRVRPVTTRPRPRRGRSRLC